MSHAAARMGGAWLVGNAGLHAPLTPEQLPEEHRLIARTAREFALRDVMPALAAMESHDWASARQLLHRAGELGLIGVDVPEAYGGVGLDTTAAVVVSSALAANASFSALFGAQANLAIGAILHFGNDEQRARYLPGLTSGEIVGAYALSESGSGSDALAASARAIRKADGAFALNGEKMWVTNGGFADLFIVFAKVDGEHFTAFVVERGQAGVSTGAEERKMGLHGSSTAPLLLQDVAVPVSAVLGEVGAGHRVAFNVLNLARLKLGAMCLGTAQNAIGESSAYATARVQFGRALSAFGAIRHKIGEMTARAYAIESLLYRVAGLVDDHQQPDTGARAALEELALEASIVKVAASEMLDYVVDENVQIHGGNGFVRDYPAERHFRDARVNRIFEGTNEINRLVAAGMLVRRAARGDLPILTDARRARDLVLGGAGGAGPAATGVDRLAAAVTGLKTATLSIIGMAVDHYGQSLTEEQEILVDIADMAIATLCTESAWLRARDAAGDDRALHLDAATVFASSASAAAELAARHAAAAILSAPALRTCSASIGQLLAPSVLDTVSLRRRLADESARLGRYIFQ